MEPADIKSHLPPKGEREFYTDGQDGPDFGFRYGAWIPACAGMTVYETGGCLTIWTGFWRLLRGVDSGLRRNDG